MNVMWRMVPLGVLMSGIVGASLAQADVTGSFDGALANRRLAQPIEAAASFSQIGPVLTGTVALGGDATSFGGAYLVQGRATTRRVKLSGFLNGVRFNWRAKIVGETLVGKARLKGPGAKLVGSLTLARNAPLGDGTSCDAVFTQNQTFFVQQVLGQALTSCTTCHKPGGQAEATRLHVTQDPLATARAISSLIDAADPTASRILRKPLALLPHGGGQQITVGSTQEEILNQWVDLVVQAHCS